MNRSNVELAFKCGLNGTEWMARLGPIGPRLGFVSFRRPGVEVELPPVNKAADLRRRLDELLSASPPLPPPQSAHIVSVEQ